MIKLFKNVDKNSQKLVLLRLKKTNMERCIHEKMRRIDILWD